MPCKSVAVVLPSAPRLVMTVKAFTAPSEPCVVVKLVVPAGRLTAAFVVVIWLVLPNARAPRP